MDYIGWPSNVNRAIIDETNVSVGEGATITDSIEGTTKQKKRVTVMNPADKFNVTMHFDCYERFTHYEDGTEVPVTHPDYNTTEKDRFFRWYKNLHKFGTVPFEFPSILWNSNMRESFSEEEILRGQVPYLEHYIITSAVEGNKLGNSIAVKMTWETYATGIYEVPYNEPFIDSVEFHNGYAIVLLENESTHAPVSNNFQVTMDGNVVPASVYNSDKDSTTFYIVYPKVTSEEHEVKVTLVNIEGTQTEYTGRVTKES